MSIRSQRPKGLGANLLLSVVGWLLLFTVSPAVAQTEGAALFGPETFVRGKGKPTTETRSFNLNGFRPPFTFHLQNNRVSSARVWLNGQLLFDPSAFSQQVLGYDVPVDLTDPSTLKVWLASKPGSELTAWIEGVPNTPPLADAGPDQISNVLVGDVVLLDGSASRDADGDALTYSWSLMAVPAGSAAELSDPTVADPNFVADEPGTYTAWLTVNDGFTDSAVDEVSITVVIPPPVVSITAPENLSVVTASPVTVTGTVDDPNATLTVNGVPVANTNGNYTTTVALQEGSNPVTVIGQNSTGEGQDSVDVILNTVGAPALKITLPKNDFLVGEEFDVGTPFQAAQVIVGGAIKVNTIALLPENNKPSVTVNGIPANVMRTNFFGQCGLVIPFQCWVFTATIALERGNRTITAVGTDRLNRSSTVSIGGIVDYCRIVWKEGNDPPAQGEDPGVLALAGPNHDIQNNRCHEIDGCSAPVVGPVANDPFGFAFTLRLFPRPFPLFNSAPTAFGAGTIPPSEHFVHGLQSVFNRPCNRHDVCYQTCVADPDDPDREAKRKTAYDNCNAEQNRHMKEVCRQAYPAKCPFTILGIPDPAICPGWLREKLTCYGMIKIYTAGVESDKGRERFDLRQEHYCAN